MKHIRHFEKNIKVVKFNQIFKIVTIYAHKQMIKDIVSHRGGTI